MKTGAAEGPTELLNGDPVSSPATLVVRATPTPRHLFPSPAIPAFGLRGKREPVRGQQSVHFCPSPLPGPLSLTGPMSDTALVLRGWVGSED